MDCISTPLDAQLTFDVLFKHDLTLIFNTSEVLDAIFILRKTEFLRASSGAGMLHSK